MKPELLKGLTEEQIAKVKACKSSEELLKLAKAEGLELNDEQLEAVSGEGCSRYVACPNCGAQGKYVVMGEEPVIRTVCDCPKCGAVFLS